jgi:hypothetical protein
MHRLAGVSKRSVAIQTTASVKYTKRYYGGMKKMDNKPCKDCNERYRACWGSCEKYLTWREEYDRQKEKADKGKALYYGIQQYEIDRNRKFQKKRGAKK